MATRCCSPPESSLGSASSRPASPRHALVSRQWLYRQPELRREIDRLREQGTGPGHAVLATERATRASLQQRLGLLLEENRRLRSEITDLKAELAIGHGQRRTEH